MIRRDLAHTLARLTAVDPVADGYVVNGSQFDPDTCLWCLRIPQSGAIFLENWQRAIRIVTDLRWTSRAFLTLDDSGCPELQVVISPDPDERRAALRAVSHVRSETGIPLFLCDVVRDWMVESRGLKMPDEVTQYDLGGER